MNELQIQQLRLHQAPAAKAQHLPFGSAHLPCKTQPYSLLRHLRDHQKKQMQITYCALLCSSDAASTDIACHHNHNNNHIPSAPSHVTSHNHIIISQRSENNTNLYLLHFIGVDFLLLDVVRDAVQTRLLPLSARHYAPLSHNCPLLQLNA